MWTGTSEFKILVAWKGNMSPGVCVQQWDRVELCCEYIFINQSSRSAFRVPSLAVLSSSCGMYRGNVCLMYIVCNVPIVYCMTSYVNTWRVDFGRVLGLYILYDVPFVRYMKINISFNGCLMFGDDSTIFTTEYIMKSVLLSKSTFWLLEFIYNTKMQKKSFVLMTPFMLLQFPLWRWPSPDSWPERVSAAPLWSALFLHPGITNTLTWEVHGWMH